MKTFTYSSILFLMFLFVATNKIKAQTPLYWWSFDSTGERIDRANEAVQRYCTPAPNLSWGCDRKFGRGCICCFRNISVDFPGGLPKYFGLGIRKNHSDSTTLRMFLAAGTPIDPIDYLIWSHKVPLSAGENYLFKCYVKNLNISRTEGKPIVKLQVKYLDGPQAGVSQDITSYQSIATNHSVIQWDSIEGAWHNSSNCNATLEVLAAAPGSFALMSDTFGFLLGIDSINLSLVCGLNTPTTWCAGKPVTFAENNGADVTLDSMQWYVNNTRVHSSLKVDSVSMGINYTPRSYSYTFTTADPAAKIKIVRYFGSIVDSCSSYINVLPAVAASFTATQEFSRQFQLTNTSTSATSYRWDISYTGGHTFIYTASPTFTVPYSGTSVTITLAATGSCGTDSTTQTLTICAWTTPLSIGVDSTSGLTVYYQAHGFFTPATTSIRYYWSFGDGTYSAANDSSLTIAHTYSARGNYRVNLIATKIGCGLDSATLFENLCPTAATFTQSSDSICAGDSILVSSPYSHATSYRWYVNGEIASTAQSTYLKLFPDTVNSITLVVNTGCNLETFASTVYVSLPEISQFAFSTNYPAMILKAKFPHGSVYNWTVTNSSNEIVGITNSKNYTIDSLGPGTYTACLEVIYKGCVKSTCKSVCLQQDIRDCCKGCSTSE